MQALILAAGCGKRLHPLTDYVPKSLVEVNGVPLLVNALECLSGRGIEEVVIVVGDKREIIVERIGFDYKGMRIVYVENPRYQETNNIYSFWLAQNYVHDDVVMLECDLFYRRSLVDKVLEGSGECNILVSPYDAGTMDGTVIAVDGDGRVKNLVIKRDQGEGFDYEGKYKTVNVYTFKRDFIKNQLFPFVDTYVQRQSVNSYYELVLGGLIYWGNGDVRAVEISSEEWCEIDDMEDLRKAEEKFGSNG